MRILLDNTLGNAVKFHLRRMGHDVIRSCELITTDAPDPRVADLAIGEGRHIVTTDRGFRYELREAGVSFPHALVVLRDADSPADQIVLLDRLLTTYPAWRDRIHYIVTFESIRVRSL